MRLTVTVTMNKQCVCLYLIKIQFIFTALFLQTEWPRFSVTFLLAYLQISVFVFFFLSRRCEHLSRKLFIRKAKSRFCESVKIIFIDNGKKILELFSNTVKLGHIELGYNKHSVITNNQKMIGWFRSHLWWFIPVITNKPSYNKQKNHL